MSSIILPPHHVPECCVPFELQTIVVCPWGGTWHLLLNGYLVPLWQAPRALHTGQQSSSQASPALSISSLPQCTCSVAAAAALPALHVPHCEHLIIFLPCLSPDILRGLSLRLHSQFPLGVISLQKQRETVACLPATAERSIERCHLHRDRETQGLAKYTQLGTKQGRPELEQKEPSSAERLCASPLRREHASLLPSTISCDLQFLHGFEFTAWHAGGVLCQPPCVALHGAVGGLN